MITCSKCAKDNQDHYKFCLGCGAELPRDGGAKAAVPETPPAAKGAPAAARPAQGVDPFAAPPPPAAAAPAPMPPAAAPAGMAPPPAAPAPMAHAPSGVAPAAPAAAAAGAGPCPQCGHMNGGTNLFCGACGYRLGGAPRRSGPPAAPAPVAAASGNVVLTALRADGSEAGTYNLPGGTVTVGRETGAIFAGDSYLSPRHATFKQPGAGKLSVKDEASLNGVYKKLTRDVPVELKPTDVFRIGQEIIRFEPFAPQPPAADGVERLGAPSKGYVGRIALIIGRDDTGNAFPIPEGGVHLGRERGDILFPEDGYVSGLHCRLSVEGGKVLLTDLGSSNGTFVRLKAETDLRAGDVLLMGQQLFRISM
ncbi:MAG: FHA domain-containing protein [Polyangiaceae bacterium]